MTDSRQNNQKERKKLISDWKMGFSGRNRLLLPSTCLYQLVWMHLNVGQWLQWWNSFRLLEVDVHRSSSAQRTHLPLRSHLQSTIVVLYSYVSHYIIGRNRKKERKKETERKVSRLRFKRTTFSSSYFQLLLLDSFSFFLNIITIDSGTLVVMLVVMLKLWIVT